MTFGTVELPCEESILGPTTKYYKVAGQNTFPLEKAVVSRLFKKSPPCTKDKSSVLCWQELMCSYLRVPDPSDNSSSSSEATSLRM
jgi:hypothetical protein